MPTNHDDDAPLVPPPGCIDDHPSPPARYVDDRGPYRRGDFERRRLRREYRRTRR